MEKKNECEKLCVTGNLQSKNKNNTAGSKMNARPNAPARRSTAGADQLVEENGVNVQSTTPGHSPGVGHSVGPTSNDPNP